MNVTKNKAGANVYSHVFNYTDHLGNIRLSYTLVPNLNDLGFRTAILEENHYYPFGLKHKKYGSVDKQLVLVEGGGEYWVGIAVVPEGSRKTYQYKYNGKEFQDELGLNWHDYGARNYDAALGRWMNMDPLAENSRRWTPYNYAYNNPVFFVDPDGMQAIENDEWVDENGNSKFKDGNYTKYATAQDKEFGEALRNSGETGQKSFDYLVSEATQDIEINFLTTDASGENLGYFFGITDNDYTEINGVVTDMKSSVIDIYMGTAETFVNNVKNNNLIINTNEISDMQKDDIKIIKENNLTKKDVIVATMAHEIEHTTKRNQQTSLNSNKNQKNDPEYKPRIIGNQVLKDLAAKKK